MATDFDSISCCFVSLHRPSMLKLQLTCPWSRGCVFVSNSRQNTAIKLLSFPSDTLMHPYTHTHTFNTQAWTSCVSQPLVKNTQMWAAQQRHQNTEVHCGATKATPNSFCSVPGRHTHTHAYAHPPMLPFCTCSFPGTGHWGKPSPSTCGGWSAMRRGRKRRSLPVRSSSFSKCMLVSFLLLLPSSSCYIENIWHELNISPYFQHLSHHPRFPRAESSVGREALSAVSLCQSTLAKLFHHTSLTYFEIRFCGEVNLLKNGWAYPSCPQLWGSLVFSKVCSTAGKTEITQCNHYSCFTSLLLLLAWEKRSKSKECTASTSCLEQSWGWNLRRRHDRAPMKADEKKRKRQHTSTLTYKPSLPQSTKLFALIYHHMLLWDAIQTESRSCQICT